MNDERAQLRFQLGDILFFFVLVSSYFAVISPGLKDVHEYMKHELIAVVTVPFLVSVATIAMLWRRRVASQSKGGALIACIGDQGSEKISKRLSMVFCIAILAGILQLSRLLYWGGDSIGTLILISILSCPISVVMMIVWWEWKTNYLEIRECGIILPTPWVLRNATGKLLLDSRANQLQLTVIANGCSTQLSFLLGNHELDSLRARLRISPDISCDVPVVA